jgi:methionyl-tRNA formyltransferase
MNIAFLGEDSFSALVLETIIANDHKVLLIATPYYENFLYKRLESIAVKQDIRFERTRNINSPEFCELISVLGIDLVVTAHFEKLLKPSLIAAPRIGCINLHPSLLPKYRGMSPQHWPIILGDNETGVTIHFIEEGIDTGNILVQKKITIPPDMYVSELQLSMIPLYKEAISEALQKVKAGDLGIPQNNIEAGSYYGRFKRSNACITNESTTREAYNLIRACSKPYIGAIFNNVRIWKASIVENEVVNKLLLNFHFPGFYEIDGSHYLLLKDGALKINKFDIE